MVSTKMQVNYITSIFLMSRVVRDKNIFLVRMVDFTGLQIPLIYYA